MVKKRETREVNEGHGDVRAAILRGVIPGIIEEWGDADRPASTRQKYPIDPLVKELVKTAETGRAKRMRAADQAGLIRRLHMAFRNGARKEGYSFHFRKLNDQEILMWTDKIKETAK